MTPNTRSLRVTRRAVGLVVSVLLFAFLGLTSPALAQEGDSRAGVVVQFGDDSLFTACVDLGSDGQATGEEVLRASGFSAIIDYGSGFGGGTVCKIGNRGCSFPTEKCFCQCTMKPGDPCVYWSYFHLLDGQWRYANLGASIFTVKTGDVEGWSWGLGASGAGVQPPLVTFDQICGGSAEANVPPPTAVPSLPPATEPSPATFTAPAPQPTATFVATVVATLAPTRTPLPSETPSLTALTPSDTPHPTNPAPTAQPSAIATYTTFQSPRPSETPTNTSVPSATSTPAPTLGPTQMATQTAAAAAIAASVEDEGLVPTAGEAASPFSSTQGETDGSGIETNYIVFGVLAVILVGGLILSRVR